MIYRHLRPALFLAWALVGLVSAGILLAIPRTGAAASPGIKAPAVGSSLEAFLVSPQKNGYSVSEQALCTGTRKFAQPGIRFLDSGSHTLIIYQEIGGEIHGIPAVMSLSEFADYKRQQERQRLFDSKLGKRTDAGDGEREGLLSIKIPVKVPRGLSAITGEGETNITIKGRRRIEFSGLSQYTVGQAQTTTGTSSKFPTINFEQESQLNVEGTIGERITIKLEQNSMSQMDLGESLLLRYSGDDDGIIEEIEAGNTSLSLPGTRLIGFSAGNRGGLFGIKTRGRVGGLNFTVVTSQDKGSSNRKTFKGNAEETANTIRDFQYVEDMYFFLDEVHRYDNANNVKFPDQPVSANLVDINSVRVFLNDFNEMNDIEQRAVQGIAYAFWNPDGTPNEGLSESRNGGLEKGAFHELDREEFLVDARGYLIMRNGRISSSFALAVAYNSMDGRILGDRDFIPDPGDPEKKIRLKLIKARNQRSDYPTWNLSWRNVYTLGGRNMEPLGLDLRILKDVSGQEDLDNQAGVPYLQIFGLDTHTNGSSASSPPDNIIDTDNGDNIPGLNLSLGHLVFPFLEPFGSGSDGAPKLEDGTDEIYTSTNANTRSEKSKYSLRIRSKSQATRFNLGPDIIQDSEVVRLNNRTLIRGKDYNIDYTFGQISFTGTAADMVSDPSADLSIDFASKDIFGGLGGQQKSLLGIRAEHPLKDNYSFVGMTLLYSNQSTASQRVRVGQEPARTIIWDANARLRFRPQALTNMVNALPFANTQAPSSLDLDMEVAQSLPNPNTKGVAYVDDFEGSQNRTNFGIHKIAWAPASTPTRDNSKIFAKKGRLTWYNPYQNDRISILQIQPTREDLTAEQSIIDILTVRFEAHRTNGFPERTPSTQGGVEEPSWGGVMRFLDGYDLSRSKYLELWIRGDTGRLHIDLGEISERIDLPLDNPSVNPPPEKFRNEDKPFEGLPTGDNVATPEEDVGLDGLNDAQETDVFSKLYPGATVPADPSGDNFADIDIRNDDITLRYPSGVNGTQNNSPERNSLPDTEDLNRNGILDTRNSYIRYSVDLSTDRGYNPGTGGYTGPSVLVEGSRSDEAGGAANPPWRLIRIPLKGRNAPRSTEGSLPDTSYANAVDFVRLWLDSDKDTFLQIYAFEAVGSDWQEDPVPFGQKSGDFKVAGIGTDNPIYDPPPGLRLERDPTTNLYLLERSLALEFTSISPGEQVSATRTFIQGEDYTRYGALTMFAHGGNPANPAYDQPFPAFADTFIDGRQSVINLPADSLATSPAELFIRFSPIGGDTSNFYEYRTRVYRGWAPEYNTAKIDLELMTQLKGQILDLQSASQASSDTLALNLKMGRTPARYDKEKSRIEIQTDGKTYIVKGNPALSNIKSFTVGVRNASEDWVLGENEIWLDELRVDNIRAKRAMSGLLDLRAVLADLGNVNLSLERRSGDFQDLLGNASGNTTTRVMLNTDLNANKLLPPSWNLSIPFGYSYNRTSSVPRIRRGSDIVLTPEQKANESDVRSQSRFRLSFRKTPAREAPRLLSRMIFDNMNASLNYSTENAVSGAITRRQANTSENLNGSFSYNQTWAQRGGLKLFGWVPLLKPIKDMEFYYLPSSIRYSLQLNRNVRNQKSFSAVSKDTSDVIDTSNESFTIAESYSIKLTPIRTLSADYNMNVNRDLRNGFGFSQFQFGRETSRRQEISFRYSPKIGRWFNISLQYVAQYNENLETGGQRSLYGSIRRGLSVTNQRSASARVTFNVNALFQPLVRRSKGAKSDGFSFLSLIGRAGSALQPVQGSVSRSNQYRLFGLRSRPSLKYQLGFTDTTQAETFSTNDVTRVNSSTVQDRADASTSVRLPGGINVQTAANYSLSRTFGNANTEQDAVKFPTVDVRWMGLERLPIFRMLWTSSSINFSYQASHTRRGDGGLNDRLLTSDAKESGFNPLFNWTARWKAQMSTTLRANSSTTTDLRYQRNVSSDTASVQPSLQDRLIGTTITKQLNLQSQLQYSLSSKFFKTQSNIDLNLTFSQTSNQQQELPRASSPDAEVEPVTRRDDSTWSASLGASYRFSSRFTGGTSFRHESRKDKLRDLTNKVWEFRLYGEIEFQ